MGRQTKQKPLYIKYDIVPITTNIKGLYDPNESAKISSEALISELLNDVVIPLLQTSNETAYNFEFPNYNDILFKINILKNYNILYNTVKKTMEMVFKTQQISDDVNNLRNQIIAIENERQRLENLEEEGDDYVMDVELKNEVSVDLDRVYILYQFYFGYPESGIFDTEKLSIIIDALKETGTLQEPGVSQEQNNTQ